MVDESIASSKPTRSGGKRTSTVPALSQRDEFEILISQAADCVRAGIQAGWAVLQPGNELVLVFPTGHLCKKCQHPYLGEKCWHCE